MLSEPSIPETPYYCQSHEKNDFPPPPAFWPPVSAFNIHPPPIPGRGVERKEQGKKWVWVSADSIWHIGGIWQEWYNFVIASDDSQQTPTTAVDFTFNQFSEQRRRENRAGRSVGIYQYKGKTGQVWLLELTISTPKKCSMQPLLRGRLLNFKQRIQLNLIQFKSIQFRNLY